MVLGTIWNIFGVFRLFIHWMHWIIYNPYDSVTYLITLYMKKVLLPLADWWHRAIIRPNDDLFWAEPFSAQFKQCKVIGCYCVKSFGHILRLSVNGFYFALTLCLSIVGINRQLDPFRIGNTTATISAGNSIKCSVLQKHITETSFNLPNAGPIKNGTVIWSLVYMPLADTTLTLLWRTQCFLRNVIVYRWFRITTFHKGPLLCTWLNCNSSTDK